MLHTTRHSAAFPRFSSLEGVAVLLALAGLPLVFVPWDYAPFLHAKPAWGLTAAAAILLAWAWRALAGGAVRLALSTPNVLIGLFALWNFALCPLAVSPSLAWERSVWLAGAWVIALGWQQWTRAGGRRRLLTLARALGAAAGLTSAWVLWQDLHAKGMLPAWVPAPMHTANLLGDWRGDIAAGFGNTDFIAAFLATLYLPLLFWYLVGRRWRDVDRLKPAQQAGPRLESGKQTEEDFRLKPGLQTLVVPASAGNQSTNENRSTFVVPASAGNSITRFLLPLVLWLMTAALIVCWSVGANGALLLASAAAIVAGGPRLLRTLNRGRTRRRLIVWAAGCALVILWLVTDTPLNPHRPGIFQEAFASPRWKEGAPTRWVIWLNAFEMIRRHQLTGVGPGCFPFAFPATQSPFVPNTPEYMQYQGAYTNAAHNSLLQAWAETGPVGAALLVLAVIAAFKRLRRAAKSRRPLAAWAAWGGLGALAAWCLDAQMTFPLELPPLAVLFFVLLGLGSVLIEVAPKRHRGFAMPPFILQGRWTQLTLEMQGMQRVRAVSLALDVAPPVARALGAVALVLALGATVQVWRPVVADAVYCRAHQDRERAQSLGGLAAQPQLVAQADALYRRALAIWPRHHDCRSEYSQFLIDAGHPAEALAQLAMVRRRLNSSELHLREADAYIDLGKRSEAAAALARLFGPHDERELLQHAAQIHRAMHQPDWAARYDAALRQPAP